MKNLDRFVDPIIDKVFTKEVLIIGAIFGYVYLASADISQKDSSAIANAHSFHDCVIVEIVDNKVDVIEAEEMCRSAIYNDETPEYSKY